MAELSRRERFQKQQEAKKQAEREKKEKFGPSFEHPEYVVMPNDSAVVVRPFTSNSVDNPITGIDHRIFYSTFIKGDDGKKFPFSYGFQPWYEHPIGDIISTIASYSYDSKNQTKTYENADCPLLHRILTNDEDNVMEKGWKGSKVVLMNVIDRSDDWCAENKHTKVMVKSAKYNEEYETWNSSYGFPPSILDDMENISENKRIAMIDLDYVVYRYHYKKAKKTSGGSKIYYETFAPEFDEQLFEKFKIEDMSDLWKADMMTDEEANYSAYNFEEMELYKPSSVNFFLGRMKNFIKEADEKYEKNWLEELTEIAEEEKKEWKNKQKEEAEEESHSYAGHSTEDDDEDEEETSVEPKAEEKPVERKKKRSRRSVQEEPEEVDEPEEDDPYASVDLDEYKGFEELTEKELQLVEVSEDGVLSYTVDEEDMEECEKCGHEFPLDFRTCPSCGAHYT